MYALGVVLLAATLVEPPARDSTAGTRVTILVDAFGGRAYHRLDWGFAALVDHGGSSILFDTGNKADVMAHNSSSLGIDLKDLDFEVV
jgi:metal-dependent hydrolase (beta-lactamase superfamily II)